MKSACGGRMSESVKLCIHISTPTTPRHHRDEELPMPNVRICKTVCTDQQLVNSSNIENLRIYRTVDTNRPRVSESIELLIQIDRGCVIKKHNVRINRTVAKKQRWGRVPYGKDRSRQNQRNVKTRFRIYWTVDTDRHGGHKVWNCCHMIMGLEVHFCGHRKWKISIGCLPKSHTYINTYKKSITRMDWFCERVTLILTMS